uniref:Uncharacterized protein n=1 Tax=Populus alba TaxID=43335 RepID=A0A4U5P4L0_POPAL|nr:hypothetical protein D5086_0000226690 [Populus alba]
MLKLPTVINSDHQVVPSNTLRSQRPRRVPFHLDDYVWQLLGIDKSSQPISNIVSSSTLYPIASHLSYARFATCHQVFLANISIVSEPKTFSQAVTDRQWYCSTSITACINAGHTKIHDDRFSYRRPLPTPSTDTKSSSAAPPQNHSGFSSTNQNYKPHQTPQTTRRRHPQHPSQPASIRVYSSKGSASAGVVLFSASDRPQYHRRAPPLATDRAVESTGGDHDLQQTAVVLAFGSHACAASNNTQGDREEGNSSVQGKLINLPRRRHVTCHVITQRQHLAT